MKKRVKADPEEDAQIDSYLEAQLVADIRSAKTSENRKSQDQIPSKSLVRKAQVNAKLPDETEQYEFLDETDDGLPTN